jgi:protein-disulfide isomerase
MRISHLLVSAVAIAALSACGGGDEKGVVKGEPVAAVAPPAGKEWTDVVTRTEAGGYLMGNPDAKVKLVEYASVTCSHCREFEEEAFEQLFKDYVGTGKVSFELRNFILNPYDIPITILTQCSGPEAYFGLTQQFYQNQSAFLDGAQKADQAKMQAAMSLPEDQRFAALGKEIGVVEFFKARGISEDQANACLTKPGAAKTLIDATAKAGKDDKVEGTPWFVLNGVSFGLKPGSSGWGQVKSKLQEAGAR